MTARPAVAVGITMEAGQGGRVAVAPIVGTPRIVVAASEIAAALGFAVGVLEALADADGD
jgi:hypothetical protein